MSTSTRPDVPTSTPRPQVWITAARPKTLPAAVAPVLVGTAIAVEAGVFHALAAACALLGAVFIQIGTNYANDYHDFLKGADTADRKGPLRVTQAGLASPGGDAARGVRRVRARRRSRARTSSGAAAGPSSPSACSRSSSARSTRRAATPSPTSASPTSSCSCSSGRWPSRGRSTCRPSVRRALRSGLSQPPPGLGPGFLATAILLANNVRDVDEDRAADKRTLVVRLGRDAGIDERVRRGSSSPRSRLAPRPPARPHAPPHSADYAVLNPLLGKTADAAARHTAYCSRSAGLVEWGRVGVWT
jgi:1,4-dihydroxy-2-naphthoate polyprenyltransferase